MEKEYYLIAISIFLTLALVSISKWLIRLLPAPNFEWYIAKNYFHSSKNRGFISLISTISIVGLILGTASVIIAASFMNGMQREIKSRVIATDSHIKIRGFLGKYIEYDEALIKRIDSLKYVSGISPKVMSYALISSGIKKRPFPVIINGLDTSRYKSVINLDGRIKAGSFDIKMKKYIHPRNKKVYYFPGIVLGKSLADNLNLSELDTGKLLRIGVITELGFDLAGSTKINRAVFTGIIDLGFPEYDQTFAYINLKSAQKIFNLGKSLSYYDIRLSDERKLDTYVKKIDNMIDYPMTSQSWKEEWSAQFGIMEWEKKVYIICLSLIICLASFNILSTLYMMVKDKTKDIGVLRSMGVSKISLIKIFLNQGLMIGLFGGTSGVILALVLLTIQDKLKWISFPENTLILDYLPVLIYPIEVVSVFLFTLFIAAFSSIYPAFIASKLRPVDAFRYE